MRLTRPRRASAPALTRPATADPTDDETTAGAPVEEAARPESGMPGGEPTGSGAAEAREGGPAGPQAGEVPESERPVEGADRAEGGGSDSRRSRGGRLRGVAAAGIVAVLLGGGCAFHYGAHQLRSTEAARNRALTDTEATARVAGEIDNALARVFSYTPDGTATAERSARAVLDGRAARQYRDLFARIRDDLAGQRITLSTEAVRTGVIELDGDRARLLVFLDQTSRRGNGKATTAAAQLTVTARLENDRWRIVDIKAR
ncbi:MULTISPECIES: hypothetical protein [Streptomyces]|uniref:hypothetical protein n=1 Tax=Streptomyces TaxID=1883 RepID=UPI00198B0C8F|nr:MULTISPECIES: hypothetical protein [Streptomyces]GGR85302.1 hypothetical protein GCM10010236_44980 [Streptomyces eurythermus]